MIGSMTWMPTDCCKTFVPDPGQSRLLLYVPSETADPSPVLAPGTGLCPALGKHIRRFPLSGAGHTLVSLAILLSPI